VAPLQGNHTPSPFLKTRFDECDAAISPDGRWVACYSDESGRQEIYVRPFALPGSAGATSDTSASQWQVSTNGGAFPAWRPDGRELYYLNPADAMMAAPITIHGATLEAGAAVELFSTRIGGGGVGNASVRQYDVAPDGRFLLNSCSDTVAAPITLILNWNPAP
jgi:Tol biopolymer transport system component